MSIPFPDKMVIQASGFGPAITTRQMVDRSKTLLLDLEKLSPWRRPFYVSGCTEETNWMPIAADLSDFNDLVIRALRSDDSVRYYNEKEPNNPKLTSESLAPYGFILTFTNAPTAKGPDQSAWICLSSSGIKNQVSLDDARYSVQVPLYEPDQINAPWSAPDVVYRIFDYFVQMYNPQKCVVFGNHQLTRIRTSESNYNMGWLNYTRNTKIAEVFANTGKAFPYHGGTLLKLGEDASVLSDPEVDAELIEIRKTLRYVGVTV